MQILKGRLLYPWWLNHPWKLVTPEGEIDLWPIFEQFFLSLNGKRAEHKQEVDSYALFADETSKLQLNYKPGELLVLERCREFENEETGAILSNVHAYLDQALIWLSGRLVEIEVSEGVLKLSADKSEEVFGVYLEGNGSYCEVPKGAEKTICKIGEPDCCIFLLGGSSGFCCAKFSGSTARELLDRWAKGTIRATRIGNCAFLGRKKREVVTV